MTKPQGGIVNLTAFKSYFPLVSTISCSPCFALSFDEYVGGNAPDGKAPDFSKNQVKDFFIDNIKLYFEEYKADGLRFDRVTAIKDLTGGEDFLRHIIGETKKAYPDKYLIAEYLREWGGDHDTVINDYGFSALWYANAHHRIEEVLNYEYKAIEPVSSLENSIIGKNFGYEHNYPNQWNLVKYFLASHDETGNCCGINQKMENKNISKKYMIEHFNDEFLKGRYNQYARAKVKIAWALNIASMGTPMMFMGDEINRSGYWTENPDFYGDHRFDWYEAGDDIGMQMRWLVTRANNLRWQNYAFRSEYLDITHRDFDNKVFAFKRYIKGGNNCILVVANISNKSFDSYCVRTGGQGGVWTQILCTQDGEFGGFDQTWNANYNLGTNYDFDEWTHNEAKLKIKLPCWSVVMMVLK